MAYRCVFLLFDRCLVCNVELEFQIWNLAAALLGALLIDKIGRRTLFIISNTGMLLCRYFPSICRGTMLMRLKIAFSVWALTTSLAHTPSMTAAAHGWPMSLSDRAVLIILSSHSYHPINFRVLSLL